jgi:tetratricopeptide (TPR) repeat protein
MARARLAQAYVHWQLGDLKAAEEIAKETMKIVELRQHFQLLTQAQRLLGRILCASRHFLEGEEYFRLALETSRAYDMPLEYARAQTCLGEALLQQECARGEQSQQGIAYLEEAYATFAEHNATLDLERVRRILPNSQGQ